MSRADSDEAYVLDLVDEPLSEAGSRQHRFSWLRGDPGKSGRTVALPVDALYEQNALVVEYHERQHDRPTPHFDKPDRPRSAACTEASSGACTISGAGSSSPKHGLRLVIVRADDLAADARGRLRRDAAADREALSRLLNLPAPR